jgi:fructose-specific phosphotransferase system IIC component
MPFGAGLGSGVVTGMLAGGVLHFVKSRVKAAERVPELLAAVDVLPEDALLLAVLLLLLLLLPHATRSNVTAGMAVSGNNQRRALAKELMRLTLLSLGTTMAMS